MSVFRLEDVKKVISNSYYADAMEGCFDWGADNYKCICFQDQVLHFLFMQVSVRDKRFFDEYRDIGDEHRFFRPKKQLLNMIGGFIENSFTYQKIKTEYIPRGKDGYDPPLWGKTIATSHEHIPSGDINKDHYIFDGKYHLYDYERDGAKKEEFALTRTTNLLKDINKIWIYSKQFIDEAYSSKQDFIDDFIRLRDKGLFSKYEQKDENFGA